MKILMEITTTNYRTWHSAAIRLKEIYPDSRFAAIVGIAPGGEHVIEFLRTQKDVPYEFLVLHHEILAEAVKSPIDHEFLREFEEQLPHKSLWRWVCSDRGWGHSYLHNVLVSPTFTSENATRDNILAWLTGLIKRHMKIFEDFDPDIFLPAICMGGVGVYLFEYICHQRGIPYIVPMTVRVRNLCAFSDSVPMLFSQIDKTYHQIMEGSLIGDKLKAIELYETLMGELQDSQLFDRLLPFHEMARTVKSSWIRFVYKLLRALAGVCVRWVQLVFSPKDIRSVPLKFHVFMEQLYITYWRQRQIHRMLSSNFGQDLPPGAKYVYYPLHTSPEYSTNFQGPLWMNQLYNIEQLSKNVPYDWFVYVKEHPSMLTARVRPPDFYQNIKKFPNVRLAPLSADSHDLISNAQVVAIVTGTSGWEAIQRGIPVISFVPNYFDVMGLSKICSNIETLSLDIRQAIDDHKQMLPEERRKRIICFLAALLEHGFNITHAPQFFYEPGTPEQYELGGREMADALVKHLEKIGVRMQTPLQRTS